MLILLKTTCVQVHYNLKKKNVQKKCIMRILDVVYEVYVKYEES